MYHQRGAQQNKPNRKIDINFRQNYNFHQICKAYHQYDKTVKRTDYSDFATAGSVRVLKNDFA